MVILCHNGKNCRCMTVLLKTKWLFFFYKGIKGPKVAYIYPRRDRSRYRRPKRVSQVDKTEDPKDSEAQIPVGIRKSCQAEKAPMGYPDVC